MATSLSIYGLNNHHFHKTSIFLPQPTHNSRHDILSVFPSLPNTNTFQYHHAHFQLTFLVHSFDRACRISDKRWSQLEHTRNENLPYNSYVFRHVNNSHSYPVCIHLRSVLDAKNSIWWEQVPTNCLTIPASLLVSCSNVRTQRHSRTTRTRYIQRNTYSHVYTLVHMRFVLTYSIRSENISRCYKIWQLYKRILRAWQSCARILLTRTT